MGALTDARDAGRLAGWGSMYQGSRRRRAWRLATAFEASPGGRTWTFRIRQGVRFHDGTPLTGDDVAFSLERLRARGREYVYWAWIDAISKVSAVDADSVRIDLSRASDPLPVWLAFAGTAVVSRRAVERGRHEFRAKPLSRPPPAYGDLRGRRGERRGPRKS